MSDEVQSVNAAPTKQFFVSMLTRDIDLEDAVLDLLDNCVDGIIRSGKTEGLKPYEGYEAKIRFDAESFIISDNCGGIPWDMRDYAFRMGRPAEAPTSGPGAVGVYGIGMKRAIFKIGRSCCISTQNGDDYYEITIDSEWTENQDMWDIPSYHDTRKGKGYTSIDISALHDGIAKTFTEKKGGKAFSSRLKNTIATHYAYIIDKGFKVAVNGDVVGPKTTNFLYSEEERDDGVIRPFIYKDRINEVDVYLAVGLNGNIPSNTRLDREMDSPARSSEDAGWTVLCNSRAVLYCDRTELTGWGEGNTPKYHTQFIAISGIVEFNSDDPSKLPTTTTKRGLDASSPVYIKVKKKMREGMKIFTAHTNKWKGKAGKSKIHTDACKKIPLGSLKVKTDKLLNKDPSDVQGGKQYRPRLPVPAAQEPDTLQIKFSKDAQKIRRVASHLGDTDMDPGDVGERCFDMVHEDAGL